MGYNDREIADRNPRFGFGLQGIVTFSSLVNMLLSKFKSVGDAELVEDIVQMVLYGLLADEEFFSNFFIADPAYDSLRDDPRFRDLLRRVRLAN